MSFFYFIKKINIVRLLIALGLATIIWGFVITTQYPEKTLPPFEINLSDPVAPVGLELVPLSNETQMVRVTVSGPENVVNTVSIGQVRPFIDMTGINTPGEHNAPIRLRPGLLPPEVTATFDRRSVPIRLEPRITKTLKVQVVTQGEVNPDYSIDGDIQITPSEITVEGRQSIVEQITRAQVSLSLANRVGPLRTSQQVELTDARGVRLNETSSTLTLSPSSVTVAVNISYKLATRTVPVVVVTKGDPAPGYIAGTARANPALLLLTSGNSELLSGINFVETEPVEISGATSEVSRTVRLQVPNNVTAQFDRVVVQIGIVQFQVSRSIDIPLEAIGQSSNLRYNYSPTVIKLTLSGPLLAFTPDLPLDKIRVLVNVQNYDIGVHEIPVQIETPSNLVASAVSPVRVTITRPPPTPTPSPSPSPIPPTPTPTATPSPTLPPTTTPAATQTVNPTAAGIKATVPSPTVVNQVAPVTTAPAQTATAPPTGTSPANSKNVIPTTPTVVAVTPAPTPTLLATKTPAYTLFPGPLAPPLLTPIPSPDFGNPVLLFTKNSRQ